MDAVSARVIPFPLQRRRSPRLVSLPVVCRHFGFSERWFRYRLAEGMPAYRYGRRLRFDLDEVREWLEERYV